MTDNTMQLWWLRVYLEERGSMQHILITHMMHYVSSKIWLEILISSQVKYTHHVTVGPLLRHCVSA